MKKILLTMVILLLASQLQAENLFVNQSFNETTPGWAVTHFASVQSAVSYSSIDDIINISFGEYFEKIIINKRITLHGEASTRPVLKNIGSSDCIIELTAGGESTVNYLNIKNLVIETNNVKAVKVASNSSFVKFDNVEFKGTAAVNKQEYETGIWVEAFASINNYLFQNCAFEGLAYGAYFAKSQQFATDASNADFVSFTNCNFIDIAFKALYLEKLSNALFSECFISGCGSIAFWNKDWNGGIDINLKGNPAYSNIQILNCIFQNNGLGMKHGAALMIKARGTGNDASYASCPASLDNVNISGCTFTGNERGIRVGEPDKNISGITNVKLFHNKVYDNHTAYSGLSASKPGNLINYSTNAVNAENNYWGNIIPQSEWLKGFYESTAGTIDYKPWCNIDFTFCGYDDPLSIVYLDDDFTASNVPSYAVWGYNAFNKIEDAVTAVGNGGKIDVFEGTYTITKTLNITKPMTIDGRANVVIDARGVPASAYGIYSTASDLILKDFALIPRSGNGGYPFKIGTSSMICKNISITNVSVSGSWRSGFDFHNCENVNMNNCRSDFASYGVGVGISSCKNVTITQMKTNGNVWGGIGIFVSNYLSYGCDNINIDRTLNLEINDDRAVYAEAKYIPLIGIQIAHSNINVSNFPYITEYSLNPKSAFVCYSASLNSAFNVVKADKIKMSLVDSYAYIYNPERKQYFVGCQSSLVNSFQMQIQPAIDDASDDAVINIMTDGDFNSINLNKKLTVIGKGNSTRILSTLMPAVTYNNDGMSLLKDMRIGSNLNYVKISGKGVLLANNCSFLNRVTNNIETSCESVYAKVIDADHNSSNTQIGKFFFDKPTCAPFHSELAVWFNPVAIGANNNTCIDIWENSGTIPTEMCQHAEYKQPIKSSFRINGFNESFPAAKFSYDFKNAGTNSDIINMPFCSEVTCNDDLPNPISKTFFLVFQTGARVDDIRQTLFEAGGVISGVNIYMTNGKLVFGLWNKYQRRYINMNANNQLYPINMNKVYLAQIEYDGSIQKARVILTTTDQNTNPSYSEWISFSGFMKEESVSSLGGASRTRYHDYNTGASASEYFDGLIADFMMYNEFLGNRSSDVYNFLNSRYLKFGDQNGFIYPETANQAESGHKISADWDIINEDFDLEKGNNSQIIISPNPSSAGAEISFVLETADEVNIEICNYLGQIVYKENLGKLNKGINFTNINSSLFVSGIYSVKVYGTYFSSNDQLIISK